MTKRNEFSSVLQRLEMLSEEFDMLGLPEMNLKQPVNELLEDVTITSHLLVNIHRKMIAQMRDLNIDNQSKTGKNHDLQKKLVDLDMRMKRTQERNKSLENRISMLDAEVSELKKNISSKSETTSKLKSQYKSKESELLHQISSLNKEIHRLKGICGEEIGKYHSKDEQILKKLSEYKNKEEKYKNTIKKLEENNIAIISEVMDLKEELAMAYIETKK